MLNFDKVPAPFKMLCERQAKIYTDAKGSRSQINFLEEFNDCEFDVEYKGNKISFKGNIWQSILIYECIQMNCQINLNVLEFTYKVPKNFFL